MFGAERISCEPSRFIFSVKIKYAPSHFISLHRTLSALSASLWLARQDDLPYSATFFVAARKKHYAYTVKNTHCKKLRKFPIISSQNENYRTGGFEVYFWAVYFQHLVQFWPIIVRYFCSKKVYKLVFFINFNKKLSKKCTNFAIFIKSSRSRSVFSEEIGL